MPPTIATTAKVSGTAHLSQRADRTLLPMSWIALALLGSLAVLAWLMERAELNIDPAAPATIGFAVTLLTLSGIRYVLRAPSTNAQRIVRDLSEYVGLVMGIGLIGAVASYPLAAETRGYVDAALARSDAMLGFDWLAWYHAVSAHRSLQIIGTVAYQSIYVSPAILVAHYARIGDRASAYRLFTALWICEVLILAWFVLMPAVGPLAYMVHGPLPYLPDSERYMAELIPALRAHSVHLVDLGAIRGLVSAPSFHTASAVLFIAAARPIASLRWPLLGLNVAMLLSTPVEGTHYLTDMILGALVAGVALFATTQLFAWRSRRLQAGSTASKVTS